MPRIALRDGRIAAPWVALALCVFLLLGVCLEALAEPLYAEPSGRVVEDGDLTFDYGNAPQGYIMIKHSGSKKKMLIQVNYNGVIQNYSLKGNNQFEAVPLFMGSGTYKISVMENTKDSEYALLASKTFKDIKLPDENAAFLVPTQYAWYTADTYAVEKSMELCAGTDNPWEKAEILYNYVSQSIAYDYMKALSVRTPYLPDIDDTFLTGMGICFDYAALFACMARVQGIPTQIVVGRLLVTGDKHAWNRVLLDGNWMSLDTTFSNQYKESDYAAERYD